MPWDRRASLTGPSICVTSEPAYKTLTTPGACAATGSAPSNISVANAARSLFTRASHGRAFRGFARERARFGRAHVIFGSPKRLGHPAAVRLRGRTFRRALIFHIVCGLLRGGFAEVAGHHSQGELDSGGDPPGTADAAAVVFNVSRTTHELHFGKLLFEHIVVIVVRGRFQAV